MFFRVFSCLLFLVFTLDVNANTANEDVISLENFAKPYQFLSMKISPTGKYIAATTKEDAGNVSLTVLEVGADKILFRQGLKGEDTIGKFFWANDDRVVFEVNRLQSEYEPSYASGELFAVSADGSRPITLTGARAKTKDFSFSTIVSLLPDDKNHILISSTPYTKGSKITNLRKLNIYNGRMTTLDKVPLRIFPNTFSAMLLDSNNVLRVAAGTNPDNEDETLVLYRDNENSAWRQLYKGSSEGRFFKPMVFLPDNKTLIGRSDTQTETSAITALHSDTFKEEILAHHPAVDIYPILNFIDDKPSNLVGMFYHYDKVERIYFDDAKDEYTNMLRALDNMFAQSQVVITSRTKNHELMLFEVTSEKGNSDFYIFNNKQKNILHLLNSVPWFNQDLMPETTAITYKSRDGLTINGILTLPKNTEAKNLPLIMFPHGGPHSVRDLIFYNADAKVLASRGYAVLQPNFRGSGGFGMAFQQAGYRNWGTTMINDMTDGVQYLINQGMVDKNRICSYGVSYGGYAALQSAITEPELYKCVVGFAGVYDLNLLYTEGDVPKRASGVRYLEKVIGKDKAQLDAQSPTKNVDKLKAPVFIVHGGKDERAPIIHANRLKEELEKRNHPYEWLVKDEEGHGFYKPEHNVERWQKMLSFFEQHIGTKTH